jgi:hypothetical protein
MGRASLVFSSRSQKIENSFKCDFPRAEVSFVPRKADFKIIFQLRGGGTSKTKPALP